MKIAKVLQLDLVKSENLAINKKISRNHFVNEVKVCFSC